VHSIAMTVLISNIASWRPGPETRTRLKGNERPCIVAQREAFEVTFTVEVFSKTLSMTNPFERDACSQANMSSLAGARPLE